MTTDVTMMGVHTPGLNIGVGLGELWDETKLDAIEAC